MRLGVLLLLMLLLALAPHALGDDESARELFDDANRSHREGEIDLALSSLDRSLALDPDQAEAWVLRGRIALYNLTDREMAVEAFERALEARSGRRRRLVRARQRPLLPRQGR